MPELGSLLHRSTAVLDTRRRLVLERRVRGFLGVEDPSCFDVVVVVLAPGAVLLVPTEDFDARLGRVVLG